MENDGVEHLHPAVGEGAIGAAAVLRGHGYPGKAAVPQLPREKNVVALPTLPSAACTAFTISL